MFGVKEWGKTHRSDPTGLYVDHGENEGRRSEREETERRGVRDNAKMPSLCGTNEACSGGGSAVSDSYCVKDEHRKRHLRRTSTLKAIVGDVAVAVVRLPDIAPS